MKILNPETDLDLFFTKLVSASQKALLFDYDGTLAPFHIDPAKAYPYPGIREVLNKLLRRTDLRLVIISGRWIKDLLPLLKLNEDLEIWGCHGLERRKPDGSWVVAPMDAGALTGLVAADEWIEKIDMGDRTEKKPGCLAIHWRGLNEKKIREIRYQVESKWAPIAKDWGLIKKEFDGGMELRVPGPDKGDAVRTILKEMGKGTIAAYFGDDMTDEDAFRAIKDYGIGILVREELRPTSADIWIKPPDELLSFLSRWIL